MTAPDTPAELAHPHDYECPVALCGWSECLCGAVVVPNPFDEEKP